MVLQRTLALIKPDATGQPWYEEYASKALPPEDDDGASEATVTWEYKRVRRAADKAKEIKDRILKEGFTIVESKIVQLTKAEAEEFYAEHKGREYFESLTAFLSSAPLTAMILEKEDAIRAWRNLIGPTQVAKAKELSHAEHPLDESKWTLRALYGDKNNATHGSDSVYSAYREIEFFFPKAPVLERSTILVPAAAVDTVSNVVVALEAQGFTTIAAVGFEGPTDGYAAVSEVSPSLAEAAASVSPAAVLLVERVGATHHMRLIAGPAVAEYYNEPLLPLQIEGTPSPVYFASTPEGAAAMTQSCFPAGSSYETAIAVLKSHLSAEEKRQILSEVRRRGFLVTAERSAVLSTAQATLLLSHELGTADVPAQTIRELQSGPCLLLALSAPQALTKWATLMGPVLVSEARREFPESLRARFGVLPPLGSVEHAGALNAVGGATSVADNACLLQALFPFLALAPPADDAQEPALTVKAYVKEQKVMDLFDPLRRLSVPVTLDSLLVKGLAALAKERPSERPADACRWLGQWLIANNPLHGRGEQEGVLGSLSARVEEINLDTSALSASPLDKQQQEEAQQEQQPGRTFVFVLGAPGSGKGTQSVSLAKRLSLQHLSTGELLRAEVELGSPLGQTAAQLMSAGQLVPSELVVQCLVRSVEAIEARTGAPCRALIDGFPRSVEQVALFERALGAPAAVLSLEAPDEVLSERLLSRGRQDDTPETVAHRFSVFHAESRPVIELYGALGLLRRVDAAQDPAAVQRQIEAVLRPEVTWVIGAPGSGKTSLARSLASAANGLHLSVDALLRDALEGHPDDHPLPFLALPNDTLAGYALVDAEGAPVDPQEYAVNGSSLQWPIVASAPAGALRAQLARGDAPPSSLVVHLLRQAASRAPLAPLFLDGAPSTLLQAAAVERALGAPKAVLYLNTAAPDAVDPAEDGEDVPLYALERPEVSGVAAVLAMTPPAPAPSASAASKKKKERKDDFSETVDLSKTRTDSEKLSNSSLMKAQLLASALKPLDAAALSRAFEQQEAKEQQLLLSRLQQLGREHPAVSRKRIQAYRQSVRALLAHYHGRQLLRPLDALAPIPEVLAAARRALAPRVVFVAGAPGSGKTAACQRAAEALGAVHLSVSSLLAAEVERFTPEAVAIREAMGAGQIVPAEVVAALIQRAIASHVPGASVRSPLGTSGAHSLGFSGSLNAFGSNFAAPPVAPVFLVDGFPRSREHARALEARLGVPEFLLFLDAPAHIAARRSLLEQSGSTEHAPEVVQDALDAHARALEELRPLLDQYAALGLVRAVDASLSSPDAVFAHVRSLLRPTVIPLLAEPSGRVEGGTSGACITAVRAAAAGAGFNFLSAREVLRAELERLQLSLLASEPLGSSKEEEKDLDESSDAARLRLLKEALAPGKSTSLAAATLPDSLVIPLIGDALVRATAVAPRVILDGFPRTAAQAAALSRALGAPKHVLGLRASRSAAIAELASVPSLKEEAERLAAEERRRLREARAARLAERKARAKARRLEGLDEEEEEEEGEEQDQDQEEQEPEEEDKSLVHRRHAEQLLAQWEQETGQVLNSALAAGTLVRLQSEPVRARAQVRALLQPNLVLLAGAQGAGRRNLSILAGKTLGVRSLHATALFQSIANGSNVPGVPASVEEVAAVKEALANNGRRGLDLALALRLLKRALRAGAYSRTLLLDGFPRVVGGAQPLAHDLIFAIEASLGRVKGCVLLECEWDMRVERVGVHTAGEEKLLRNRLETFRKEKLPVVEFIKSLGKLVTIDTTKKTPDEVFEAARPFLE